MAAWAARLSLVGAEDEAQSKHEEVATKHGKLVGRPGSVAAFKQPKYSRELQHGSKCFDRPRKRGLQTRKTK